MWQSPSPHREQMPPDRASIDAELPHSHQTKTRAHRGVVRGHAVAAVNAMRDHLSDRWTLDSLADEVDLSRSQLARSFAATVGMSPMAYLRKMRVERMARLLVSTDLSIAETARSVGWRNQFHASQCFHATVGLSPMAYLRQMRMQEMARLFALDGFVARGGSVGRSAGRMPTTPAAASILVTASLPRTSVARETLKP